ncbi:alpha/beta hydrolase family protein [Streptacidiphilus sp. MAP5-3]|uniref:alpha/beta hydrolase family protein n=1 Tax=unclassified Streptacidiphilus TaxID=2643834 RepID=UPI003515C712
MIDPAVGPLDAAWVARKHTSYDELSAARGALWWLQSDPEQGGNRRLVRYRTGERPEVVTPPELSVGGWLHAYGGGAYAVGTDRLWVVSEADSLVYEISDDGASRLVVPAGEGFAYGDLHATDLGLLAVRGSECGDELVTIDSDTATVHRLLASDGFLGAPRVSEGRIAYLEWDADAMPWDSSRLFVAGLTDGGLLGPASLIAGGVGESVVEPLWGPDGALHFLSDRSGWWNLYAWDGTTARTVSPCEADFAPAPWEGGYQSYAFLTDGGMALTMHDGFTSDLTLLTPNGHRIRPETGLTSIKPYIAVYGEVIAVIGSSPNSTPRIRLIPREASDSHAVETIDVPATVEATPTTGIPRVRRASWAGHEVSYLLHQPLGSDHAGPVPLLVRAHPGPTDSVPLRLDWTVQFFTSRGFAVAEVAYRGSTGQGRAFRQALNGHWGEFDVEDCSAVAKQLLVDGIALPGAVFITGASAGGYTALQAATVGGPFSGATATSAIIDPQLWTKTAPRFQRPHAESLAGPAGAVRAEHIQIPVLLIHGTGDEIAPAADSQRLSAQLDALGKEHRAVFLDGVGHYLSSPASLRTALEAEWAFYKELMAAQR